MRWVPGWRLRLDLWCRTPRKLSGSGGTTNLTPRSAGRLELRRDGHGPQAGARLRNQELHSLDAVALERTGARTLLLIHGPQSLCGGSNGSFGKWAAAPPSPPPSITRRDFLYEEPGRSASLPPTAQTPPDCSAPP